MGQDFYKHLIEKEIIPKLEKIYNKAMYEDNLKAVEELKAYIEELKVRVKEMKIYTTTIPCEV